MRYSIIGATKEQLAAAGVTNPRVMDKVRQSFADLSVSQIDKLKSMGVSVSKVSKVKATVSPPTPIPAQALYTPQDLAYAAEFEQIREMVIPHLYGEGHNLAIVGTGIRETHEQINGRVVWRKNYTAAPMRDGFDHCTGCAAIALTVAPEAGILNMKVLDDNGEGTEEEVVAAIDDCIGFVEEGSQFAPTTINLSLGAPDTGNPNSPMRAACRVAVDKGIWVIAAAGNQGPELGTITSPATEKYVAAVGSCSYEPFAVSEWSARGPTLEGLVKPDLVMFGENIIVASSESDTATIAKSGTSFSTPFISGFSILYVESWGIEVYTYGPAISRQYIYVTAEMPPIPEILDTHLGAVTSKPEGLARGVKDNDYGFGVIYGSLLAKAYVAAPGLDLGTLLVPILAIGMIGMMMKVVTKEGKQ